MSVTGYWLVTAAPDQQIRTWRERHGEELAAAAVGREQTMAWWAGLGDDIAFLEKDENGRWLPTHAGSEFEAPFWEVFSEELVEEIIAAIDVAGAPGSITPGMRKSLPATAFYQALGVADSARIPGSLGDFLVTADEVPPVLAEVERLLADSRREELIARVDWWLDSAADDSPPQGRQIVEGLLRVFRLAAEHGLGVAACSAFF